MGFGIQSNQECGENKRVRNLNEVTGIYGALENPGTPQNAGPFWIAHALNFASSGLKHSEPTS